MNIDKIMLKTKIGFNFVTFGTIEGAAISKQETEGPANMSTKLPPGAILTETATEKCVCTLIIIKICLF